MDKATINRYQPGGDLYLDYVNQYGTAAANTLATAALTGDQTQITAALSSIMFGSPLPTSTASIFLNQISSDPLAAPLADAETIASNTFVDFFKSPAILISLAIVLFFVLGGAGLIRGKLSK